MSAPTVGKILVALKATVNRNVRKHSVFQVSGSSEKYGSQLRHSTDNKGFKSAPTIYSAHFC